MPGHAAEPLAFHTGPVLGRGYKDVVLRGSSRVCVPKNL